MKSNIASRPSLRDGPRNGTSSHIASEVGTANVDNRTNNSASVGDARGHGAQPGINSDIPAGVSTYLMSVMHTTDSESGQLGTYTVSSAVTR